jgi:hypothetical protein
MLFDLWTNARRGQLRKKPSRGIVLFAMLQSHRPVLASTVLTLITLGARPTPG